MVRLTAHGWWRRALSSVVALGLLSAHAAATQPALTVTAVARSLQPGEVVVVEVRAPAGTTRLTASVFDREVPCAEVATGRWAGFAGIDLDVPPGSYAVDVRAERDAGEALAASTTLDIVAKAFGTRTLRVAPKFVTPPPSVAARLKRERERMAAAFSSSAARPYWSLPFEAPIAGRAVSGFGVRSVFNGEPRDPHGGADLASPTGTPVHAPNDGRVALAARHYFPGKVIVIDHGLGVFSLLAHLSHIDVAEGAIVRKGQVVGRVGQTGRVTGPHLHWATRVAGARVDPFSLIAVTERLNLSQAAGYRAPATGHRR
jgi:murein DD-endopeptidase MepM/ murein hydrolase activator NlpD